MEKCSKKKQPDYVSTEMQKRIENIEKLMKWNGYQNRKDFAHDVDILPQNFSRDMNSYKISEKTCRKIIAVFPDYRIEWLLGYDDIPTHYDWADSIQEKKDSTAQCCWGIFEHSLQKKGQSLKFIHRTNQHLDSTERLHSDCYYSVVDNEGNEIKRLTAIEMVELEQKLQEYSDFLTDRYL